MADKNLIHSLSELSKLEFSEKEFNTISNNLDNIIQFADKVKKFDTKAFGEKRDAVEYGNLRDDECFDGLTDNEATLNIQKKNNGCFTVPKVI
ncbi:MAG: Asp-tRNA(Asn)/Glu-tRNA(Gln) amidotransferase subunit GatC [Clostridia bacterium]|nr:Asp-tRNA(Asn)/Glu-tRNA(Gln) amidotransferase subunit GatC [Clostridia bacterium]